MFGHSYVSGNDWLMPVWTIFPDLMHFDLSYAMQQGPRGSINEEQSY